MHFKKISNFHVFCTQTYAKCRFWANFVPTCEYKTSRDLTTDGPIFANLVSKDAQDLKEKKSWKGVSAVCGGREAVADFVQGGVKLTHPPVKIGVKGFYAMNKHCIVQPHYTCTRALHSMRCKCPSPLPPPHLPTHTHTHTHTHTDKSHTLVFSIRPWTS